MRTKPRKSISDLIKPYPGHWVALSQDDTHVVGVASSPQAVLNKARRNGEVRPHLVKAPDGSVAAFIF